MQLQKARKSKKRYKLNTEYGPNFIPRRPAPAQPKPATHQQSPSLADRMARHELVSLASSAYHSPSKWAGGPDGTAPNDGSASAPGQELERHSAAAR